MESNNERVPLSGTFISIVLGREGAEAGLIEVDRGLHDGGREGLPDEVRLETKIRGMKVDILQSREGGKAERTYQRWVESWMSVTTRQVSGPGPGAFECPGPNDLMMNPFFHKTAVTMSRIPRGTEMQTARMMTGVED